MNSAIGQFPPLGTAPDAGSFLLVIFVAALIGTAVMSAILFYHWFQYGAHAINPRKIALVYGVGVAIFLFLAGISI